MKNRCTWPLPMFVLLLFIAGCTAGPSITPNLHRASEIAIHPTSGKATICLFRPGRFGAVLARNDIFLNNEPVVRMASGGAHVLTVAPGRVDLELCAIVRYDLRKFMHLAKVANNITEISSDGVVSVESTSKHLYIDDKEAIRAARVIQHVKQTELSLEVEAGRVYYVEVKPWTRPVLRSDSKAEKEFGECRILPPFADPFPILVGRDGIRQDLGGKL